MGIETKLVGSTPVAIPDTTAAQVLFTPSSNQLYFGQAATIYAVGNVNGELKFGTPLSVSNGILGQFAATGLTHRSASGTVHTIYSATFTPSTNYNGTASVSLNAGSIGYDYNVWVGGVLDGRTGTMSGRYLRTYTTWYSNGESEVFSVNTVRPSAVISADSNELDSTKSATITFTLSAPSQNFSLSDIQVSGGKIENFSGSGSVYSAKFIPTTSFSPTSATANISVPASAFTPADNSNPNAATSLNLLVRGTNFQTAISGNATQGQTLVASSTLEVSAGSSLTYIWKRGDAVVGTGSTYTLSQDDVGKSISLVASYEDASGITATASNNVSSLVSNVNDSPVGSVTISGAGGQGQTLTASNTLGDADGLGEISYTWKSGSSLLGKGSAYTLLQSDVGKAIFVTASYTDGFGFNESVSSVAIESVTNTNDSPTGAVSIVGTAARRQGQTLRAINSIVDEDGVGAITYAWKSGDTILAVGSEYVLTQADVSRVISLEASYVDGHGNFETVSGYQTLPIANVNDTPTGSVRISGDVVQGQTLSAFNDIGDVDGVGPITYAWFAGGAEVGRGEAYTLSGSDVGRRMSVVASYVDSHGTQEILRSASTTAVSGLQLPPDPSTTTSVPTNNPAAGLPNLRGTFTQGQRITVDVSKVTDKDGMPKGPTAFSYLWYADGVQIDGTTGSTLTLTQSHVGKAIAVTTSYTDLKGTAESVTSTASRSVANVNDAPTGSVVMEGVLTQGQTLLASNMLADLDGLGIVTYQWNAGGKAIAGATSDSYVLTQAQVGQTISVTASYTDGFGKAERVTSLASAKVANANDAPTGQITMTGTVAEDQTLTANTSALADADGLGKFNFQWQSSTDGSSWTNVVGANKAAFKLGDAHVGRYVRVNVAYTDKLGTAESVTSEASALVANVNDKPVGVPIIAGKFIEGEILTANTSKITDADGLGTFSYLWQTSTDKKTWIDAGTDTTLQLSGTSARQSVQLTVSYTDGGGTAESVKSTVSAAIATKALTLLGGDGSDALTGWSGADRINGGGGADILTGGAGADVFIYRSTNDSALTAFDGVLDFSSADKIDLKGIDAMTSKAGDQAFAFSRNVAAKNAVWWDSGTLYGDNTGDAVADFAIYVNLVGLPDIKASNIIL